MRLRDVKIRMRCLYKGKLAMVDQLLVAPSVNKWSLTVRIKQDGMGLLVNHRDLRPYVEPKQEPAKTSPAVGSLEWAKEEASKGRELTLRNNKMRWKKNGDKWEVNMMNGEGWAPTLEIFCEEGWHSHDPNPVKTSHAVGSAEWAEEQGRAGKKIVGDAFDPKYKSLQWIEFRNDGNWYYSDGSMTANGVGPLHDFWGSKVWRIYEEPMKNDFPPWQPEIRLPADPTEAAIRIIEYRIAKVRRESSDKICALEATIEELRKGWKP